MHPNYSIAMELIFKDTVLLIEMLRNFGCILVSREKISKGIITTVLQFSLQRKSFRGYLWNLFSSTAVAYFPFNQNQNN